MSGVSTRTLRYYDDIKTIIADSCFNKEQAFQNHLAELNKKRERLDLLISNVTKSIAAMKGEVVMADNEKFDGFKQSLIDENEKKYGKEIRKRYGDTAVDGSNAKLTGLTQEQYDEGERLQLLLEETLKDAFDTCDPAGELAQKACDLHRQWLCVFYPNYSKEYHKGLGEMYVTDERFCANYDKLAPGCTEFFRNAINIYCGEPMGGDLKYE
jgi:DNA-binding transcriptional MerR regulator